MGKQNQYDHSVRMPLIIRGPGIKAGKKVDEMVYMQSMFATTCDLAGIPTPETVDFKSLKKLMTEDKAKGEEYIFGVYSKFQRMVRSQKYKLIVYPEANKVQLFDIENDPYETINLYNKKGYKKTTKKIFTELKKLQEKYGDNLRLKDLEI